MCECDPVIVKGEENWYGNHQCPGNKEHVLVTLTKTTVSIMIILAIYLTVTKG